MMERREQTNIEKKNKQMLQNDSSFLIPINSHKMQEKQRWKNTPISITSPQKMVRERKRKQTIFF